MMEHCPNELICEFIDGRLDAAREKEVAGHLAACAICAMEVELARASEQRARRATVGTSPGFTDAVMARIIEEAAAPQLKAPPRRSVALLPAMIGAAYLAILLLVGFGSSGSPEKDDGGWLSGVLGPVDHYTERFVAMLSHTLSGTAGGGLLAALLAIMGVLLLDSVIARRIPRGPMQRR